MDLLKDSLQLVVWLVIMSIHTNNVYRSHTFTDSGPFNVTLSSSLPNNVDYLIVGGDGGGGGDLFWWWR